MNKEEKENIEKAPLDASLKVNSKEARKLLKENGGKVQNGDVEAFVRLKDINKIYPNGVQAVYDFNMDIKEHEFIVLVGPSGCGKSTTLRMVAGLEDITSGYLYINKVLSNYLPSKDRDISMVFQSYALYPQMTVFDNIAFPLRSRKYTKVKKVVSAIVYDELQRLLADPEALKLAIEEAEDKKINFTTKKQYISTKFEVLDETVNALGKSLKASVILEKKDEILHLASIAECNSNHPIALSIINSYGKDFEKDYVLTNVAGEGIIAEKNGEKIYCGNEKLMENNNINFIKNEEVGTVVYVAKNDKFFGSIIIADEIKDGAKETIESLSKNGGKTIMLTGDNEKIAESVAESLKLTDYKASLLPQNKVEEIDKIFKEKKKEDVICFVGDGINDAPSLMRSDIGIAMGGVGSDAAIEAADMVLMHDDLKDLIIAKKISKKTMRIAYENIIFSLAIKMLILILSAFGITNMWIAVFGDVGVAVIAILNAMRVNSKY